VGVNVVWHRLPNTETGTKVMNEEKHRLRNVSCNSENTDAVENCTENYVIRKEIPNS
jgi:hypothetical protein